MRYKLCREEWPCSLLFRTNDRIEPSTLRTKGPRNPSLWLHNCGGRSRYPAKNSCCLTSSGCLDISPIISLKRNASTTILLIDKIIPELSCLRNYEHWGPRDSNNDDSIGVWIGPTADILGLGQIFSTAMTLVKTRTCMIYCC
jgi:hypothetical protein